MKEEEKVDGSLYYIEFSERFKEVMDIHPSSKENIQSPTVIR